MELIKTSEQIDLLAKALIGFHNDLKPITKDSTNPHFRNKYASLSGILKGIKEPLLKNKLVISQFPVGEYSMTTIVMHESGQFISGTYEMRPTKADNPQQQGSAQTYQRRYGLGAILALDIDDDDDGNASSGITPKAKTAKSKDPMEKYKADAIKALKTAKTQKEVDDVFAKFDKLKANNGWYDYVTAYRKGLPE